MGEARGSGRKVPPDVTIRGVAGVTALLPLHLATAIGAAAGSPPPRLATALSRLAVIHRRSPRIAENYAMALDTTQQSVHGHGGPLRAIKLSAIMANRNMIVTHGTRPQRRIQVYAGCVYVAQDASTPAS